MRDQTPGIGLAWYLFAEVFDYYREIFLAVFWMQAPLYVAVITARAG